MRHNILFMYDDSELPSDTLKKVIGNVKFSDIIYKKRTLRSWFESTVSGSKIVYQNFNVHDYVGYSLIRIPSCAAITDFEQFKILVDKIVFSNSSAFLYDGDKIVFFFYSDVNDFANHNSLMEQIEIPNYCLKDISNYSNFIQYISGGFDTRFFNQIAGSNYEVTKTSSDKIKLNKEYNFVRLLPDSMKQWVVFPYNFREDEKKASYDMERLVIPDMAIRWIHGAVDLPEFTAFLDKYFYFITTRVCKDISPDTYQKYMYDLYITKTGNRIQALKETPQYKIISTHISAGTKYNDIDEIYKWYVFLYNKITNSHKFKPVSVIGHGDPFFANILYDYGTNVLKFIDPKGANTEEDLWSDPYYDAAKLSHSVMGNYDFIINELFEIRIDKEMCFSLSIDKHIPNSFSDCFLAQAAKAGFDTKIVRLFEASLFLSMLPLHIENQRHVLAFILNAINILQELENA